MNPEPGPPRGARVSIISAADDHPSDLCPWLRALGSQTLPAQDYEVILVDATHRPDHLDSVACFYAGAGSPANVSYHRVERGGRARALNRALELATGDLIIFLGYDFMVPPGFAEAHLRFHEAHTGAEDVGIGAAIIIPELRTPFSAWLEESGQLFGVPFTADMTAVPEHFFYVGNASVKRELLRRVGRFDERFEHHAGDDLEFGQRLRAAGMRSRFVTGARAGHVHSIDLGERERAMRHAGAAARVYMTHHPENCAPARAMSLPSWRYRWRVAAARVLLTARTDAALVRWWQTRLDAAVAAGYRGDP